MKPTKWDCWLSATQSLKNEPLREHPNAQAREAEEEEVSISDFSEGFWADLLQALNVDAHAPGKWWTGEAARKHVAGWLGLGLSEDEVIAVARKSREKQPEAPNGPKALDAAMAAAARAPRASKHASPEDVRRFWAEKLNADGYVAPSAVSIPLANDLIRSGLVPAERLRSRGIAFSISEGAVG